MRSRANAKSRAYPCVVVDVNTQRDFLESDGSCPVVGREALVSAIRRMVAWVKRNQAPVISAVDCHRPGEVWTERRPRHCIDGSRGQEKIDCTMLGSYVKVEGDSTLALATDLFRRRQQVIFRKRTADFFLNPKADRFMTQLIAGEYIIFGLGIEESVKAIALSLVARHKKVSVVRDSCGYWNRSEAELALRQMAAKGVKIITVDELSARKLSRPIRYPSTACEQVPLRNGLYASAIHRGRANNGRGATRTGRGRNGRTRAAG